jgi:O-antigen ligase
MIEKRAALTRQQVGAMISQGGIGSRAELYRNTWQMGRDRWLFGWGMGSYPHVFGLYNRQTSVDNLPVFYNDAHSDWLQAFAEHGVVGSALLALCAIVPLLRLRRTHFSGPIAGHLLAGCALLLLYAWVEFPFGNIAVVFLWWLTCFCAVQYARLQDRESPGPGNAPDAALRAASSP